MSEVLEEQSTVAGPSQAAAAPTPTSGAATDAAHFGHTLAAARQRMGLSQAEMAARLRLHLRQVIALEEADLAALPELAFIRGYLRNYARMVGLDDVPLIDELHARAGVTSVEVAQQQAMGPERTWMVRPLEDAQDLPQHSAWSRRTVAVLVAVVLGVLLILATVGVVASRKSAPNPSAQSAVPANPTAAEVPSGSEADAGEPSPVVVLGETALPSAASAPQGPPVLRVVFKERGWAQIAQGDGRVVLSQVLEAGSARQFADQPPYRLLVGDSRAVTVQWRDRTVDLRPYTSFENVVRLTLE